FFIPWTKMSCLLWTVRSPSCISAMPIIKMVIGGEAKMHDPVSASDRTAGFKKNWMRYVQLAVLFGLLLGWKIVFLMFHPLLGSTWATLLAYGWISIVLFLYLNVTKQSFAAFFYFFS